MKKQLVLVWISLSLLIAACNAAPATVSTEVPTEVITEEATLEPTREDTPINRGETLFRESRGGFACATCHYPSTNRLLGPGLADIEERFESYGLEEMTVEEYIRISILVPVVFIAPAEPAYPENLMPTTYRDLLTDEEINDLIAYILSL